MAKIDAHVLIIDDNEQIRESLELYLGRHFSHVSAISTPNILSSTLSQAHVDLVLLDMNFAPGRHSGNEGLFWLREIIKQDANMVVILITAYADVKLAVEGMKEGAFDFIVKPWDNKKLLATIQAGLKHRSSLLALEESQEHNKHLSQSAFKNHQLVLGESPAMKKVVETLNKVAQSDANVLILGENGTGKEVIAREIFKRSKVLNTSFIAVDVGAISESLFESELFGHVKGAFTDAQSAKKGMIELANKGTLFLDEIANIPIHLQAKLLRVIQERELRPLGSEKVVNSAFRLISATNKSLYQLVQEGLFREDLLYRLNTVQIELPPLRERAEDIPALAQSFLQLYAQKYHKTQLQFSQAAIDKLQRYNWPGNIRELRHIIEKAVIMAEGNTISSESFSFFDAWQTPLSNQETFDLAQLEQETIQKVVKLCEGNMSKASEMLGISRTTLYAKMKKYGV